MSRFGARVRREIAAKARQERAARRRQAAVEKLRTLGLMGPAGGGRKVQR